MKILRRLIPFAKPLHHFLPEYIIYTVLGIIFGLLNFALLVPVLSLLFEKQETASQIANPEFSLSIAYFKDFFNYQFNLIIASKGKFMALVFVCITIGISILLANIFRYMAVRVLLRLRLRIMARIRNMLYDKYIDQSLAFHHKNGKGDLLMTMTSEVQEIESSVLNSLQILLRDPFLVIAYFGLLFYWSYQLTLFTLIFLPITGLAITMITRKLKKMSYFSQEMMSKIISSTEETISGIKPIQSYTAESFMKKKFRQINDAFSKHSKQLFSKKEIASPTSEVLGVMAALMLVVYGGYLIFNDKSALGGEGFIAYLALYTQIIQPLKNISQISITLQRGIVATEKIFKISDSFVSITDPVHPVAKKDFTTSIKIEDVSFSYESQPVIDKLNLTVPKGKIIALVGQSGSGKSTIIDLVCRFYDVLEGSIKIDNIDIKNMAVKDLRGMMAVVSQDAFLFNDTVFNNIALHNPSASKEEVEHAAKVANAHEFINEMPLKYETIVGERGSKLSGGQRQRITIARAILKNPPILILDEATSSLDTESERLVQDAINNMMQNRTSIVIAHRLSTIRHADEIIVLQKGKIVERGNHEELLAQNGFYRKLVDLQEVK